MDRRDFLRSVGAASAALSAASAADEKAAAMAATEAEKELFTHFPGARFLKGQWRLRLDQDNTGKKQIWYQREPTDAVSKAFSATVPACWQETVPDVGGGVGWYFKELNIRGDLKDRILRLKFWAVDYFAEVWLNGQPVGSHEGGYTPFELDVTHVAKVGGLNRLVVRVVDPPGALKTTLLGEPGWDGKSGGTVDGFNFKQIPHGLQWHGEGFNFGGIWQPVELLDTDPIYLSDVFIEPKLSESAIVAHLEVTNKSKGAAQGKVHVVVKPWKEPGNAVANGEKQVLIPTGVSLVEVRFDLSEPRPWSPDDPYLYVAEVSVADEKRVRHTTTARFGFREFTVKDGYLNLNGKRIFLKGGHYQGTYPTTLQYPPTREFAYKEVRIFKEGGFNFSRLWQKPTPFSFLDAADELGLMLEAEPALGEFEDSPHMRSRALVEVREAVKRDRNRPSIVIWNMINELYPAMRVTPELCGAARELDPTRLITESSGGPSHYYLPYSGKGTSYLDEHFYPGAPVSEDVYEYCNQKGIRGQLNFHTEYGFGGMADLDSVLADYGPHPKVQMEDYRGHFRLKQIYDEALQGPWKNAFADMKQVRESSQAVQADAVGQLTEAMRANPAVGGYNYCQVFDSNAIELDGLVDFWRNKRKKAFYVMQELNKPLLLIVRSSPMNARSGGRVELKVTLVNEDKIEGRKRLTVRVKSPSGREVFSREALVDAKPWVSIVFEEKVQLQGKSGRYPIEAALWDGSTLVVEKKDYCTLFHEDDLKWPPKPVALFDVEKQLEPFLRARGIQFAEFDPGMREPGVILVTPFTALWDRPEQFEKFVRIFDCVERGCQVVFVGIPSNGGNLVTGSPWSSGSFFSQFAVSAIFPLFNVTATPEVRDRQRIGAYAWGLKDPAPGVPILKHPVFEGVPQGGFMGREYGNVVPVQRIQTYWKTSEDTGTTIQIHEHGKGKIILTSLNLLENMSRDALAEKLLANIVNYANRGLPGGLAPENPKTLESMRFEQEGFQDCLRIVKSRSHRKG